MRLNHDVCMFQERLPERNNYSNAQSIHEMGVNHQELGINFKFD